VSPTRADRKEKHRVAGAKITPQADALPTLGVVVEIGFARRVSQE